MYDQGGLSLISGHVSRVATEWFKTLKRSKNVQMAKHSSLPSQKHFNSPAFLYRTNSLLDSFSSLSSLVLKLEEQMLLEWFEG